MSYVDALFDRDSDIVLNIQSNIHFIMKIKKVNLKAPLVIQLVELYVRTQKSFEKNLLLTKARRCLKVILILSSNV